MNWTSTNVSNFSNNWLACFGDLHLLAKYGIIITNILNLNRKLKKKLEIVQSSLISPSYHECLSSYEYTWVFSYYNTYLFIFFLSRFGVNVYYMNFDSNGCHTPVVDVLKNVISRLLYLIFYLGYQKTGFQYSN